MKRHSRMHAIVLALLALLAGCQMPARLRPVLLPTSRSVQTGIHHLDQEQFASAVEAFVTAIEYNPRDAVAHAWLGIAYARLNRFTDAHYSLRIARDLGETTLSRIGAGECWLGLGDPAKAMKEFAQAAAMSPSPLAYEGMARAAIRLNDIPQAQYAWQRALDLATSETQRRRIRTAQQADPRLRDPDPTPRPE